MTTFRLTREQRAELFAGNCPAIFGPRPVTRKLGDGTEKTTLIWERCPLKPGDRIELSRLLAVEVLRVDPRKGGHGWKLHYLVDDRRDPSRYMRRSPPVVVPEPEVVSRWVTPMKDWASRTLPTKWDFSCSTIRAKRPSAMRATGASQA